MARCWYVLRSKPRSEEKVLALLTGMGIEVYLPIVDRLRVTRFGHLSEPLFRSYVFVNVDVSQDDILKTRSAPGVAYVLSADGKPSPVADELIDGIRHRLDALGGVLKPRLVAGDRVEIASGPLSGLEAIFDARLNGAGRSRVLLSVLGRQIPVTIGVDALLPADMAAA